MKRLVYKYTAISTIVAVFLLILVGGIVRSTGSGMGCPDWPKCFGMWIPPTSVDELPVNYAEIFGKDLKGEVEFNVIKTWTEYVNRLLGVLIGFLIFLTFVSSFWVFWKSNRSVVALTFLSFVLVGFQGWLGSRVVATELLPWMVTTHLLVAVVIVLLLIWALIRGGVIWSYLGESDSSIGFAMLLLFLFSLGQFLLGTRVRETIDFLNHNGVLRDQWIENLGGGYVVHGISAILLLMVHYFFVRKIKLSHPAFSSKLNILLILVLLSVVTGAILGFLNMPAFAQPIHLTLATLILGTQFTIYMVNNKGRILT